MDQDFRRNRKTVKMGVIVIHQVYKGALFLFIGILALYPIDSLFLKRKQLSVWLKAIVFAFKSNCFCDYRQLFSFPDLIIVKRRKKELYIFYINIYGREKPFSVQDMNTSVEHQCLHKTVFRPV